MDAVPLAGAKARLSGAVPRRQVDLAKLRALTATMPPQLPEAAGLVRSMRDEGRA